MSSADHAYIPPDTTNTATLPSPVKNYLDGADLLNKNQALRISTVAADGWPHAALFSAGDMLAMPSGKIRFAVFAQSTTAANLTRDGRVTITLSVDGSMCELRMKCRRLTRSSLDVALAVFEAELIEARLHNAPYATVSGGVTFTLHEPQSVQQRWQKQISAIRDAS